jgi:hypothetical protein
MRGRQEVRVVREAREAREEGRQWRQGDPLAGQQVVVGRVHFF